MVDLMMTDNDFRDGAGCFGNNDGVPPPEVSEHHQHCHVHTLIIHSHYHPHQNGFTTILQALAWAGIPSPNLSNMEVACPAIS